MVSIKVFSLISILQQLKANVANLETQPAQDFRQKSGMVVACVYRSEAINKQRRRVYIYIYGYNLNNSLYIYT